MGNVIAAKHSSSTAVTGSHSNSVWRTISGSAINGKNFKSMGGKLPPLHVVKDSSVQTDSDPSVLKSGIISLASIFILISIVYFGLCYIIICSKHVQSLIVYSHYDHDHFPLRNLLAMGLPEAKNIDIITEDGVLLRGWHLMHPGDELLHANSLPDPDRDLYFDEALARAERIVLYFHGNSHCRGQGFRLRKVKQLAVHLKAHVIAFDYRGFADSEGYPSEELTHVDARAAVHYIDNIVRRYNPRAVGYLPTVTTLETTAQNKTDILVESEGIFTQLMGVLDSHRDFLAGKMASLASSNYSSGTVNATFDGGNEQSADTPSTDQTSTLKGRLQPHLFLYGHSLGAAITTAIAAEVSNLKPGALSGVVLDSPFTKLPDALRHHPLTSPFRIFPWIFNMMISNLQIIYPNIHRVKNISAPLMFLHGDHDIKINASHSRLLFLKATSQESLPDETAVDQFGFNAKNVTFAVSAAPTAAQQGIRGSRTGTGSGSGDGKKASSRSGSVSTEDTTECAYPVERHIVKGAGHNEVYASREWLALLPDFVRRAESFVEKSGGVC